LTGFQTFSKDYLGSSNEDALLNVIKSKKLDKFLFLLNIFLQKKVCKFIQLEKFTIGSFIYKEND